MQPVARHDTDNTVSWTHILVNLIGRSRASSLFVLNRNAADRCAGEGIDVIDGNEAIEAIRHCDIDQCVSAS